MNQSLKFSKSHFSELCGSFFECIFWNILGIISKTLVKVLLQRKITAWVIIFTYFEILFLKRDHLIRKSGISNILDFCS